LTALAVAPVVGLFLLITVDEVDEVEEEELLEEDEGT
jgi:hypothetical protein